MVMADRKFGKGDPAVTDAAWTDVGRDCRLPCGLNGGANGPAAGAELSESRLTPTNRTLFGGA